MEHRGRAAAAAACAAGMVAAYAALGGLSGAALAATKVVLTKLSGTTNTFDPASVTVNVNDTVSWTNPQAGGGGVGHNLSSTSSNTPDWTNFDNKSLAAPGSSTSFKFVKAGTYKYQCTTHGPGMAGTVVVKAKPKPSPSPTKTVSQSPAPQPSTTTSPPQPSVPPSSSPPVTSPSPSAVPSATLPVPTPSVRLTFPPQATGRPPGSQDLGKGGLTAPPATGRERGLPVLIAVVFLVGVVTAEVRTLLATPVDDVDDIGE